MNISTEKDISVNDMIVIGVDPGIRNTAIAVLYFKKNKIQVLESKMLRSFPKSHKNYKTDSQVLKRIGNTLEEFVFSYVEHDIIVGVESVFHTKFLTSATATAKVIGVCHYIAGKSDKMCIEISPPSVKKALGLSGKDKKDQILKRAEKLLNVELKNHHMADACGVAIASHLKLKLEFLQSKSADTIKL